MLRMKEFNKTNTVTYNLMSFTGFKSLLLFSLLAKGPQTNAQIQAAFKNHEYLKEDIAGDTLRVYINSLRRVGCVIERKKGKYVMLSHPFELSISQEQIRAIIKIYRIILNTLDVSDIFEYEKFVRKLISHTNNSDLKEALDRVSVFKNVDTALVQDLIKYCAKKRKITILYNSPRSSEKDIQVIANKLGISQGKIYLYGVSLEYNQDSSYLLSRILKVLSVDIKNDNMPDLKPVTVGYELSKTAQNTKLTDEDRIVEITDNGILVETTTTNLFMTKRKLLEFGPLCTVLYPDDFREDFISTLKKMQKEYSDG